MVADEGRRPLATPLPVIDSPPTLRHPRRTLIGRGDPMHSNPTTAHTMTTQPDPHHRHTSVAHGACGPGPTDPAPDECSPNVAPTEDTGWCCPVCWVPVEHLRRPGRARVYCTNSCKQRAYRWRRRHRHEFIRTMPPERAHTYDTTHALRPSEDFTARQRRCLPDGRPHRLTACGTFAAAARDSTHRVAHTKFYVPASHRDPQIISDGTCRSCATLLGVPIEPLATIVDRITPRRHRSASP